MKSLTSLVFALVLSLAPVAAAAAGAFAVGDTGNIAKDGVAVGVAGDSSSPAEARADALKSCRSAAADRAARDRCKVVRDFKQSCASVAMDPRIGSPGFGWAVAKSELRAKWDALAACKATAGAGGDCRVLGVTCDGFGN